MTQKSKNMTVGNGLLFAILHYCFILTCIVLGFRIIEPVADAMNGLFFKTLVILGGGIGGIAIYLTTVPTLSKVEDNYYKNVRRKK